MQELLDESNSYADLLRKVDLSVHGGNRDTLRKIINEYDLDLTRINENRKNDPLNIMSRKRELSEILVENSQYKGSGLLPRLIKEGYKTEKCDCCGIENWNGNTLKMQLHHKNGNHQDNRLENLEALCPNCHSQTDNFAGKNSTKIPKLTKKHEKKKAYYGISEDGQRLYDGYGNYKILCPKCKENFMNKNATMCRKCYDEERLIPAVSKEELFEIINQTKSYCSAAELLGVGSDTVSRWHKYYVNEENKNNNEFKLIGSDKAPSREVLKTQIRTMSFIAVGKEYHVTDNSVRKWCDVYNLPRLKSIIDQYSDEEWELI